MMSMQRTRPQQTISLAQSVAVVQTLLRAGLGCITFLRNLLPEDNFSESHFTTSDDAIPPSSQSSASSSVDISRQRISGFKIMTMARGYSEEADRILNYLEYGIFDALGKQYLRSFIFAIYLDNKDPNNIVEAYTFNFRYHKLPGCDSVVPIMTLGEDISSPKTGYREDPVIEATERGKTPTLRDVKKSVKTLLKTLIHAMSQMDMLPSTSQPSVNLLDRLKFLAERRYAAFKLFYTDNTPSDYEPPNFQPGDAEKDRWYLMTHNLDEVPDKWSIGRLSTGHHSVNLSVTSITTYLPSTEHQDATFSGTMSTSVTPQTLTPMQEAAIRAQQIEQQEKDAETRNLVWSGEADVVDPDMDADGEDDPDYIRQPDGSFEKVADSHIPEPLGVRAQSGSIEEMPLARDREEAVYGGDPESVPAHLKDLNLQSQDMPTEYDETQTLAFNPNASPLPPSDLSLSLGSAVEMDQTNEKVVYDSGLEIEETQMLARMSLGDDTNLRRVVSTDNDTEDTSSARRHYVKIKDHVTENEVPPSRRILRSAQKPVKVDEGLKCECDISLEDECCFCEGGCERWFHIWCMGYHTIKDKRLPVKFVCLDCRLRSDSSWSLIKSDLYPRLMTKYRDLALFRRSIKTAEKMDTITPAEFAKRLGTNFIQSRHMFKRLEEQGFVQQHIVEIDTLGMSRSRPKKGATKHRRNNIQKTRYQFNKTILGTTKYLDYFNPCLEVENKLLGIAEMVAKYKSHSAPNSAKRDTKPETPHPMLPVADASSTQDDMYMAVDTLPQTPSVQGTKRPGTDVQDTTSLNKRIKISVTAGVDLAE